MKKKTADWGFFGGTIEGGESKEEALIREIKEELDYVLKNFEYFKTKVVVYDNKKYEINIFLKKKNDVSDFTLCDGQGMGFYSFEDAKKLELFTHDYSTIDELEEYLT